MKLYTLVIILSNFNMKIDLSRDPLFQKQQSPLKQLKQKQRERQKQLRLNRMNPNADKPQLQQVIIDPLPKQLQQFKNEIEFKKNFQCSKASQKLKKYIIEQQRNLKCVRLQKIDNSQDTESSRARKSDIKIDIKLNTFSREREQKKYKQINIPKIEQIFKNQQKEYVLYESRMMRNQLSKAIGLIDTSVNRIKSYSFSGVNSNNDTRKNTVTDKFQLGNNLNNLSTNPSTNFNNTYTSVNPNLTVNLSNANNSNANTANEQQGEEIDSVIKKKLQMSQRLRDRLYRQKKQMSQAKQSSDNKNLNFFINIEKKPKRQKQLQGIKYITFCQGQKTMKITPASSLLFQLNKMSQGRNKKQVELQGLIQNSYQNRQSILSQKSVFYQRQTPFNNLSPSNRFKLRQIMDKKLMHRLELSKEQINKFIAYLSQIKDYHVILNETILQILKEVRIVLLSGKVMKSSDLTDIIQAKHKQELMGYPNQLIIQKLSDMMI